MFGKMKTAAVALAATACAIAAPTGASAAAKAQTAHNVKQFVCLPTYRVGEYARHRWWDGMEDMFSYVNRVRGGVNGVKLNVHEYESEWEVSRGIQIYEQCKHGLDGSPLAFFITLSTPLTYALEPRAVHDKIPLLDIGGGRPEAKDGLVFPYEFPLMLSYYSQGAVELGWIARELGGYDKLKGKNIVSVYNDSAYGRATQPIMAAAAKKFGFQNIQIPVPNPGVEQAAIWRQVRADKPAFVVLHTWGVQTPVAIKTAVAYGIPVKKMLGEQWAGATGADVIPAGKAADGFCALTAFPEGTHFALLQQLKKEIVDKGLSFLPNKAQLGAGYYNVGVIYAILVTEAMRAGMSKFGDHVLNAHEMEWGLQHMNVNDARLKQIGASGLMQPIHTTPANHEGGGAARIQCWNGHQFYLVTDWIKGDTNLAHEVLVEMADVYAKAHGITPKALNGAN